MGEGPTVLTFLARTPPLSHPGDQENKVHANLYNADRKESIGGAKSSCECLLPPLIDKLNEATVVVTSALQERISLSWVRHTHTRTPRLYYIYKIAYLLPGHNLGIGHK